MLSLVLHTLVLLAAGVALFRLWRYTDRFSRAIGLLVAGAVLLRTGLGVAMFWVSYLKLPFGASLQLGDGFWWFASDATGYYGRAVTATRDGVRGILFLDPRHPSVFYNKILAGLVYLLGTVSSVGLLLNVFSFVGMAAVIVMWAKRYDVSWRVVALPVIAIGYSPSWIVWSTQPLKDAFFCFVIVAFAVTFDHWIGAWRDPQRHYGRIAAIGVLLAVLMYALAGVRWYYAVIAFISTMIPIVVPVFASASWRQRLGAACAAVVMLFVLNRQIVHGADVYLPPAVKRVMDLRLQQSAGGVVEAVEESRGALDSFVNANTRIRAGEVIRETENPPATAVPAATTTSVAVASPAPAPAPPPAHAPAATPAAAPAAATPAPAPAAESSEDGGAPDVSDVPLTVHGRLIAGFAAMLLPQFVAEGLGLISLGDARGLWWFANTDTILFDVLVIVAAVMFFRRLRATWRDPFAWYVLAVSVGMAGAIAYTISNFGALMRHRAMVLSTIILLPVIAYRARQSSRAAVGTEPASAMDRGSVPLPADG